MVKVPHVTAMVVVAAGIGAADIVRLTQQHPPEIQLVQQWVPAPRPDPEIQAGRDWLDRKAQTREREFQQQQREQAQDRRDLRLERLLVCDHCGLFWAATAPSIDANSTAENGQ
jgi:hypothetical protein